MLEIYLDMDLKNKLVDLLLIHEIDDFYCFECFKYASKDLLKSDKEQVSGRKEYILFRIFLQEKKAKKILKIIKEELDATRMQIVAS